MKDKRIEKMNEEERKIILDLIRRILNLERRDKKPSTEEERLRIIETAPEFIKLNEIEKQMFNPFLEMDSPHLKKQKKILIEYLNFSKPTRL